MIIELFVLTIIWLAVLLIYFRIADRYNIIDKPNTRSSHAYLTIRGGGIIFPLAALLFLPLASYPDIVFSVSLLLIAVLSFYDDVKSIKSSVRLTIQSLAVVGLLYSIKSGLPFYWYPIIFVVITGVINAYNFMDGINGITILYSLVTFGTIYWLQLKGFVVLPEKVFSSLFTSFLVFAFFNVRTKAKCFAGDVGSVSLAFLICFLILQLSVQTGSWYWILLLGVYGIDTVFTIFCRILRRETLMEAHRSHFYQFLVNELGWSHIKVSLIYASLQLILNYMVIKAFMEKALILAITTLFCFLIIYIIFRLQLEGRKRLFVLYNPA